MRKYEKIYFLKKRLKMGFSEIGRLLGISRVNAYQLYKYACRKLGEQASGWVPALMRDADDAVSSYGVDFKLLRTEERRIQEYQLLLYEYYRRFLKQYDGDGTLWLEIKRLNKNMCNELGMGLFSPSRGKRYSSKIYAYISIILFTACATSNRFTLYIPIRKYIEEELRNKQEYYEYASTFITRFLPILV